ncbi:MAG: antitoxin [Alphaproteobacteria bacterium]|nr:antitoxin [Alphaproteobacteria bacterium]
MTALTPVTIHAAKTTLSQLVARAEAAEEIILARGKHPACKLVPLNPPGARRQFGALAGQITVPDSIMDPLPPDELAAWEQRV